MAQFGKALADQETTGVGETPLSPTAQARIGQAQAYQPFGVYRTEPHPGLFQAPAGMYQSAGVLPGAPPSPASPSGPAGPPIPGAGAYNMPPSSTGTAGKAAAAVGGGFNAEAPVAAARTSGETEIAQQYDAAARRLAAQYEGAGLFGSGAYGLALADLEQSRLGAIGNLNLQLGLAEQENTYKEAQLGFQAQAEQRAQEEETRARRDSYFNTYRDEKLADSMTAWYAYYVSQGYSPEQADAATAQMHKANIAEATKQKKEPGFFRKSWNFFSGQGWG